MCTRVVGWVALSEKDVTKAYFVAKWKPERGLLEKSGVPGYNSGVIHELCKAVFSGGYGTKVRNERRDIF